jgi:membrane-bound lytic murein transglycosylase B
MNGSRRWARRAMLSALTGGSLTAVGLTGPLSAGALGADLPAGSPAPADSPSTPVTSTSPEAGAPAAGSQQASATTSTPPPSASASVPSSTVAAPSTPPPAPALATPQTPPSAPTVVVQRKQKTTAATRRNANTTRSAPKTKQSTEGKLSTGKAGPSSTPPGTLNGVAAPPQVGSYAQPGALAAMLAGSAASVQALDFYRIPLFLLPVYQAAGIQYGVPWQVLAAINEVETDYGSDLSVSTAGAVGWMQFMPATWQQYGVDAVGAGYADPYNPVDAIFAAARYLHAAGASSDLHQAILAYNHSEAYLNSVLLRARLIAGYPESAIATLTGLTEGRLPTAGARIAADSPLSGALSSSPSSATANAALAAPTDSSSAATPGPSDPVSASAGAMSGPSDPTSGSSAAAPESSAMAPGSGAGAAGSNDAHGQAGTSGVESSATQRTPGSSPAPSPVASAASVTRAADAAAKPSQLVDLIGAKNATVVAVQDGRVVKLGRSRKLGAYLVLRDVYGDVFTYAGLGSIAPSYRLPKALRAHVSKQALVKAGPVHRDPAPKLPASAGHQSPVTLRVKASSRQVPATEASVSSEAAASAPAGMGKVRLFAHPNNPDALAVAARADTHVPRTDARGGRWLPLRRDSVVSQGTVLGRMDVPLGARAGHLRFAIRPAGDASTVDPRPILESWRQLNTALHPDGVKGVAASGNDLLGATANDVFLLSKSELEREVLSDPGIDIYACGRQDIASGIVDKRVLAVLAFLSRSGLKPTVSALRCGHSEYTTSGNVSEHYSGDAVDISEINGISIAAHQGQGTITDTTIRTLLTLQGEFVPHQIISLMQYPGASNTLSLPDHWNHIHVGFRVAGAKVPLSPGAAAAAVAHSAASGQVAPSPLAVSGELSSAEWNGLMTRIAALPTPVVAVKPNSAAIRDPQAAPGNRDLGTRSLPSG